MNLKKATKLMFSFILAALVMVSFSLLLSHNAVRAQGGGIFVDKRLGRSSNTVYVGEYLTFTIQIRNDSAFTITTLPLIDDYNNKCLNDVLVYVDAYDYLGGGALAPDLNDQGTCSLVWNDLTAHFGDLAPGQEIWVMVGFIAENPSESIVNAARVEGAVGDGGQSAGGDDAITETESIGGSSPVEKQMMMGLNLDPGELITFTISFTNDNYITMTVAPLVDIYNSGWLEFAYADPPPDLAYVQGSSGVLSWTDVTSWTGDIPAHDVVSVTTVFTILTSAESLESVNSAEVKDGKAWDGRDLDGGADDVPITIIEGLITPTPVQPTATPAPAQPTATPAPSQPTPEQPKPDQPTATPYPTPTMVVPLLPETGEMGTGGAYFLLLLAMLLVCLGAGVSFWLRRQDKTD